MRRKMGRRGDQQGDRQLVISLPGEVLGECRDESNNCERSCQMKGSDAKKAASRGVASCTEYMGVMG